MTPTEQTVRLTLRKILLALQSKVDAGSRPQHGICKHVWDTAYQYSDDLAEQVEALYGSLMKAWPEYSGSSNYPVPCPIEALCALGNPEIDELLADASSPVHCAELAYDDIPTSLFWDESHPYGAARIRLLAWMIAELAPADDKESNDD